jgi:hypothetical protein
MILLHGTTRWRAERILAEGPDIRFAEPGEIVSRNRKREFTMNLESGPFWCGHPEDYARGKAAQFPAEGGPVILALDVSEEIVSKACDNGLPVAQGLIQFEPGSGLEELIRNWPSLVQTAQIRSVE